MIDVLSTDDKLLSQIFKNRNNQAPELWDTVKKDYKKNIKIWSNNPDWLATVPRARSKTRDNRIFMATESQINKVTARPLKPMVSPANETDEAKEIAENLQTVFLEDYEKRSVKKNIKRGLRYLHFSRLICLKVFWNIEIDNYDVKVMDPRKIKVSKNATKEVESEFAIETIDDKTILDMIDLFPNKEAEILTRAGMSKETAMATNPDTTYHEMWIGDGVVWMYKNEVLEKIKNPMYDFDGLLLTPEEMAEIKETTDTADGQALPRLNGRRRRQMFSKFKSSQGDRRQEISDDPTKRSQYEVYLYNHHDKPRKPYIFGTILEVEDKPIGETTLIQMVAPLQEGVDKRKRQIADNADFVNGITKVDTDIVTMSLADARKTHYDPEGLVYGAGVSSGVTREFGTSLPAMVFQDLQDSRNEIDEIMGTTATLRGSGSDGEPTATGRAILREEGISRLDEIISLVDFIGAELYDWWFQLIKVKYTETHLVKSIGANKAARTIELMQDDIQEGIEIKIPPGQTLPEDKLFKAERAREDAQAGLIDPVTYFEQAGGYDNPERVAKRSVLFKANPFNVLALDDDDLEKIKEAHETIKLVQGQPEISPEEVDGQKAQQVAQLRQRMEQIVASPEFQDLPPEEQEKTVGELKSQLQKLGGVEFNRQLA
jgi:hypothetical protein